MDEPTKMPANNLGNGTETPESAPSTPSAQAPTPEDAQRQEPTAQPGPAPSQTPPPGWTASQPAPPYGAAGDPYGAPASPYGQTAPANTSGKAIAALVCGILAILFSWTIVPGVVLGIVAIVLAGKAVKEGGKDGKTTGGKVCGIVGIVFSVLMLVFAILFGTLVAGIVASADRTGSMEFVIEQNGEVIEGRIGENGGKSGEAMDAVEKAVAEQASVDMDKLVAQDETLVRVLAADLDDQVSECMQDLAGTRGMTMAEAGIDPKAFARWALEGMAYTVDSVYVDGNGTEAEAYLTVTKRDERAFFDAFSDSLNEGLAQSASANEVDWKSLLSNAVSAAQAGSSAYTEEGVSIEYKKVGDQWEVEDADWCEFAVDDFIW